MDIETRAPLKSSTSQDTIRSVGDVKVFHPGHDPDLMLFAMPCFDHVGEEFGVNHRLVRGACYIITNNEDGFLAADRQGTQHVPASDHLLRAGKYYYHLARSPGQVAYLVVVDFRSWRFPGTVPAEWRRVGRSQRLADIKNDYARSKTAMSETVKTLDRCCIITGYVHSCENAHLVPCERNDWFKGNGMDQFCLTYDAAINDVANGVALRADVRACLDRHSFVFFPSGDGTFVPYVIKNEKDYAQLLHRRSINIHERVAEEFLYARFAYTVIHLVSPSWDEPHLSVPIPLSGLAARPVTPRTGPSAGTAGKIEETDAPMDGAAAQQPAADCSATARSRGHTAESFSVTVTPLDADLEYEKHWNELLFARFPKLKELPEVEDPPDFPDTTSHVDVPRMKRLKKAYREAHPEVYQVTGPTASERDAEAWEEVVDDDLEDPRPDEERLSTLPPHAELPSRQ